MIARTLMVLLVPLIVAVFPLSAAVGKTLNFGDGSSISVPDEIPDFSRWVVMQEQILYSGKKIGIVILGLEKPDGGQCVVSMEVQEGKKSITLAIVVIPGCEFNKMQLFIDTVYLKTGVPSGVFEKSNMEDISNEKMDNFIKIKESKLGKIKQEVHRETNQ
jgi:hypothetical protein